MTRRTFTTSMLAAAAVSGQSKRPIRLGAPIFLRSEDPEVLAKEHQRLGYSAAYFPPYQKTDATLIEATRKVYAAHNLVIAEVGGWANILAPDPEKRKQAMEYVTDRMRIADEVDARCCVDTAGSFAATGSADPRNVSKEYFDATVENCRKIIDAVKPKRAKFTIEMMFANLPDGPESYIDLIKAVDRKEFGVHMDVCNVLNSPTKYYNSGAYIDELFKKLGQWVISCHAKDLTIPPGRSLQFVEVIPGRGIVDYKSYLRNLAQVPREAPLMLEHFNNNEEFQEGANFIRKQATSVGVTFVA